MLQILNFEYIPYSFCVFVVSHTTMLLREVIEKHAPLREMYNVFHKLTAHLIWKNSFATRNELELSIFKIIALFDYFKSLSIVSFVQFSNQ